VSLRARVSRRTAWRNHTGNQGIDPLRIYKPATLGELVDIVREAERDGTTVRAVGSGHSWSDVALTRGFLVETHGLNRIPDGPPEHLRAGVDGSRLVWTEAGIRIRELNAALHARGLALANMGGYDGQTIAGVISTSTHGSGMRFGPLSDIVRSLDLVVSGGAVVRVEPADGPTDPAAHAAAHPERELIQDDDTFHAAVVGMGCMGIVYGVTIEVVPAYCLCEVRTLTTWEEVKRDLLAGDVLQAFDHYEVLVNPYPRAGGEHRCLVTTRTPVACDRKGAKRSRSWIVELVSAFPPTSSVLNVVLGLWPRLAPRMIDAQLKAIARRDFENVSYKVLNIGNANLLHAYSAEIGVPVDDAGTHVRAVELIFEIARRHREVGEVFHSSAMSLRFVRESPAFASMMHGRDTMMIELIQLTHTEGGMELLADYEEQLYRLDGRPHWGQVNTLTGSNGLMREMYERWDDWLAVHARFNASGVFDSPFSKRVGISESRFGQH
jgi:FAD binding domain-containing protein/D-arabinono-1,4-lactone oxidase